MKREKMDNIVESSTSWIEGILEIVPNYTTATIDYFLETIGITSDIAVKTMKPSDGLVLDFLDYIKGFSGLLAFDYFQWQLLKIFSLILFTIVLMIFGAWHIYGKRIFERFMDPAAKIDQQRNPPKYYDT